MQDEKRIRLRVVSVMTEPDGTRHENQSVHRGTLRAAAEGPEIVYEQVDEGVRARISLTRTADGVRMRCIFSLAGKRPACTARLTAIFPWRSIPARCWSRRAKKAAKCGWITMCLSAANARRPR